MAEGHRQDGGRSARGARRRIAAPQRYLEQLTCRLGGALGDELAALWLGGSAAMGAYEEGRSDIDVIGTARGRLDADARDRVVAAVRHEELACPARKLELVVHAEAALRQGEASVELNLETGPAGTSTPDVDSFWFVIDLSVVRAHGRALAGPAPSELVAEPPRAAVLGALAAALEWHARPGAPLDDAVLNACRVLLFLREGRWSSKRDAGEWALAAGVALPALVADALAMRSRARGAMVDPAAAAAFARRAYRLVAARSASSSSGRRNS